MGQKGYNRVMNDFNWDKVINDYLHFFKRTLEEKDLIGDL